MDTTGGGQPTPDPTPPDTTTPPPAPTPTPEATPTQTVVEPTVEPAGDRPPGVTLALGLGYSQTMGMWQLDAPNIASARLRLATGLTFEPRVEISNETESDEPAVGMESDDKETTIALSTLVRLPIVSRGKADLEAIGSLGFLNNKVNPEGDYNAITTTTFSLGYGVGIGYWFSNHWQLSMTVTNPLISYSQIKSQTGVASMTNKSSRTELGIEFTPTVALMIHLYN
jgi:hypothetical protein